MQINFIAQVMAFERWLESNPLPTSAQLLWYKLFVLFDRCGWAEWVQVDNLRIMVMIGAHSEKSAILAREKLIESGLIQYEKGKKSKPGKYKLNYFDCNFYSKNDSVFDSKNDSENAVKTTVKTTGINKHKHKQSNDKENIKRKSDVSELFNSICVDLPSVRAMTDSRRLAVSRAEKTIQEFGGWEKFFIEVQSSDFLTGRDGKWHGCGFDWIIKASNMQKIMEGTYRNKNKIQEKPPASYDIEEFERQLWEDPIMFE